MAFKNSSAGFVSLAAVTATGPGKSLDVQGCKDFSIQVAWTSDPTVVVNLEASLDDPNVISDANATWFTIATSADTSGDIASVTGVPVRRVRCNLATLTGGVSPAVTAKIAAV